MKKYIFRNISTIIILSILLLTGCSNIERELVFSKQVTNPDNIKYLPIASQVSNVSIGLLEEDGTVVESKEFKLSTNEDFEYFINVANFMGEWKNYQLITFIDYKQSEFYVDDIKKEEFIFSLENNKDIQIPVALKELSEGIHDVIFAIIKDPGINLTTTERLNGESYNILYIRVKIIVGESNPPLIKYVEFNTPTIVSLPLVDIFLHDNRANLQAITYKELTENEFNCYLTIGNSRGNDIKNYAILLIDNGKQINVTNSDSVLFVSIPYNETIQIPLYLHFSEPNLHNINAILIEEPYGNPSELEIYNSIRVGLNVK